ncbi:MAG TPA: holo-ACP synthase [Thermopetrobacter sp.]|nr:holo-ACP synthase [Thermopetrobacter sp.]
MIVGIGTDLVDARRIARLLERHGQRFLDKVFSEEERALAAACADPAPLLARRFAAKEAAAKALGSGFRDGVGWRDISTGRDDLGRPCLTLSGGAAARLERKLPAGMRPVLHVALSDEPPYAQAMVVIEGL